MSSEFQNLIKTKNIGSITPSQILDAGSNIFFDLFTNADITAINRTIPAYAHIHAPIYGQPIPLSGAVATADGSETLLAPTTNEVRRIIAISCENTGGAAPIIFDITLGGMIILTGQTALPSSSTALQITSDLFSSKNLPLAVVVTSGTAGELTSSVVSIGLTQ
jgi:hypothetical protein